MSNRRRHLVAVPAGPAGLPYLIQDIPFPDAGRETARAMAAAASPEIQAQFSQYADDLLDLLDDHGVKLGQATMRAVTESVASACAATFAAAWVERSTAGAPVGQVLQLALDVNAAAARQRHLGLAEPIAQTAVLEEVSSR